MNLITLSDSAENHIKQMLMKNANGIGFRLSIKKPGCSGFAYVPLIIEKVLATDLHFTTANGLAVYIDPECQKFIEGLVVDYVADTNQGLKQKRLVFTNPNEKNRCGCGESFTIE